MQESSGRRCDITRPRSLLIANNLRSTAFYSFSEDVKGQWEAAPALIAFRCCASGWTIQAFVHEPRKNNFETVILHCQSVRLARRISITGKCFIVNRWLVGCTNRGTAQKEKTLHLLSEFYTSFISVRFIWRFSRKNIFPSTRTWRVCQTLNRQ